MISRLRAAQRALSCLARPAAEKYCHLEDNAAPVLKCCLSHEVPGCAATQRCDLTQRHAGRDAAVAREYSEYFSREEMTSQGDVAALQNLRWNATGMKCHSRGNTAGHRQTMEELWVSRLSYDGNVPARTLKNITACDVRAGHVLIVLSKRIETNGICQLRF